MPLELGFPYESQMVRNFGYIVIQRRYNKELALHFITGLFHPNNVNIREYFITSHSVYYSRFDKKKTAARKSQ